MTPKKLNVEAFSIDVLTFRTENKLTRNALLKKIGGGQADIIRNIENDRHRPTLDVAYNLCELMGKTLNDYMIDKI